MRAHKAETNSHALAQPSHDRRLHPPIVAGDIWQWIRREETALRPGGNCPLDGVIVIDKPEGWTSHDGVNKVRRIAQTKKVGHLGTLDPIATGVLPLVIERATRLAQFYTHSDKIYQGVVRFG